MSNKGLTKKTEWQALQKHQAQMQDMHMRDLFADNPERFKGFHIALDGLLFDYSKHLVTKTTIQHLISLARVCDLEKAGDKMFAGAAINESENRAALHTALRGSVDASLEIEGENVSLFVEDTQNQIKTISDRIRNEKKFSDVVCLGIGGSDLGPHMVCEALQLLADGPNIHFVSNIDATHLMQTIAGLKPETTLFIIASKTFTTLETITNAKNAKIWANKNTDNFIAITANSKAAADFGIAPDHILPMRDWIGGRYSLWSAIGLPIAVSAGFDNYKKLLDGAQAADRHFREASLEKNIPVIMAMLGIWYRNFFSYESHAILPYAQNLHRLPAYIQQLDMESNGKSVNRLGHKIDYVTSPVIFGEPGTNAQHAFMQMLHQGTSVVPADFIVALEPDHDLPDQHSKLLANALAQSQALMEGNGHNKEPHRQFEGNRPSSTFILDRLDPYHLGMLLALYEHKVFVQGVIWNINSFDQWGVELGKDLAKNLTKAIENKQEYPDADSSTRGLLSHIQKYMK